MQDNSLRHLLRKSNKPDVSLQAYKRTPSAAASQSKVQTTPPTTPTPNKLQISQLGISSALFPEILYMDLKAAAPAWPEWLAAFPATIAFIDILYHQNHEIWQNKRQGMSGRESSTPGLSPHSHSAIWMLILYHMNGACCQPGRQSAPLGLQASLTSSAVTHKVSTLTGAMQLCPADS